MMYVTTLKAVGDEDFHWYFVIAKKQSLKDVRYKF